MQPEPNNDEPTLIGEVFSDYVARLGPNGDPPGMADYLEVREELRGVLVWEMRRRGLWNSPPSFLGIPGSGWHGGTLDELVSDAYVFIFVHGRLRGLRDQQRLRGNIRPMVIRNVRNFLHERQQKADPLGYRIFGRLRKAVEKAVRRQQLFEASDQPEAKKLRLNNGSLLGFQETPDAKSATPRSALAATVQRWNDQLLPDLIIAEGRAVPAVVRRLMQKVLELASEGVAAFRLGDLAAELKGDARRRWSEVWQKSLGELGQEIDEGEERATHVQITEPDDEPDWPRRQLLVQECVATSISQQRPLGNRRDLWSLWTFIRSTRLPPIEPGPMPPFTEIGRQLLLTRDRVRQLFDRLKPLVLACFQANLIADDALDGDVPDDSTQDTTGELKLAERGR